MRHKTIVVTRPRSDAAPLMQSLQDSGHHAICEPLTEIFLDHTARGPLAQALHRDPDGVIVTSRNGVHALAALTELRDCALLCVGDGTAAAAESTGFSRVWSCGGHVQALADYVIDAFDADTHFIYVSAQHTHEDLPGLLGAFGIHVSQIVAYSAVASEVLSDTLVEQIRRGQIDGITFMSRRSADIFLQLCEKAGLMEALPALDAYCLSSNVAEPLRPHAWKNIAVAEQATLASLIACVDNA